MAITSGDILLKLSTGATSGNGNTATSTPAASLGGTVSTSTLGSTLFADASAAQNAASEVHYRCIFVHNTHATLTLQAAKVYVSAETTGGGDVAIAVDDIAATAVGAAYPQAARVAAETTAPTGVGSFSTPTTAGTGLSLGDLAPGQVRAFWVRRTLANTAAQADGVTFAVTGETNA